MSSFRFTILSMLLSISFSSCTSMILNLAGFKKPSIETKESIESFLHQNCNLRIDDTYAIDTILYGNLLNSSFKPGWNKGFRPVQIRIYDNSGKPIVHWSTCEGFLKDIGTFETVPPKNLNNLDSTLNLNDDLSRYFTLEGLPADIAIPQEYDYYIVIYFARFAYKLSKETLAAVYEYVNKHPELKIKVYKINVDVLDWWNSTISADLDIKKH